MVRTKLITATRVFLGSCLLAFSWNAQAAPLGLTLNDSPDVASFFIGVSYDASTDVLDATGWALRFDAGAESTFSIAGGLFILTASIDESGIMSTGSLTIRGTIDTLGYSSGTLLTGTLTDFGFGTGDPLEFLFTPTGGDLAGLYGDTGGIILSQTGFGGSFDSDFARANGVSDVATIPVPAAVWLMLSAIAGLAGLRRR